MTVLKGRGGDWLTYSTPLAEYSSELKLNVHRYWNKLPNSKQCIYKPRKSSEAIPASAPHRVSSYAHLHRYTLVRLVSHDSKVLHRPAVDSNLTFLLNDKAGKSPRRSRQLDL